MNDEQKPCPRCGYCPTCGRQSAYPVYPSWPWWPWAPPQFIWYADPRGTQISNNTLAEGSLNGITVTS